MPRANKTAPKAATVLDGNGEEITTTTVRKVRAARAPEVEPEIETEELDGDEDVLASMINELEGEGNAKIWVYRQSDGPNKKFAQCFSCGINDYSMDDLFEHIRTNFGGGDYRIQIRENGVPRANRLVSVIASANAKVVPDKTAADSSTELFRTMLLASQQQNAEVMKAIAGRPQMDISGIISAVGTVLAPVLPLVLKAMQPKQENTLDGVMKLLSTARSVKEFSEDVGGGGESSGLGGALKSLVPALLESVQRQQTQPAAQPASVAAPIAAPQPQRPAPRPASPLDALPPKFKDWLHFIADAAEKGRDPERTAEYVAEEMEDDVFGEVAQVINDEPMFKSLLNMIPALAKNQEWCIKLRAHFINYLSGDVESTGSDAGAANGQPNDGGSKLPDPVPAPLDS